MIKLGFLDLIWTDSLLSRFGSVGTIEKVLLETEKNTSFLGSYAS